MAIVAGIDEAGFGPLLGPLVVTGSAFRIPDDRFDECLWNLYAATCTKKAQRNDRRLIVADSKEVLHLQEGRSQLERTVLVFLTASGARPATWKSLLKWATPRSAHEVDEYPWYVEDFGLPVFPASGDIATRTNAILHQSRSCEAEWLGFFSEPLPEGHYNKLIVATRNKSSALLGLVMRVVHRILTHGDDRLVRINVDRLGGRMRYREALQTAFPEFEIRILEESLERSAYRLTSPRRVCNVEFATGGEDLHFCIALASMFSKYVRELYMHAFNSFWSAQQAGLQPTAGYYTDAQRWLKEAAPSLDRLHVNRAMLVRQR